MRPALALASAAQASFRHLLLLTRDVPASASFYEALGMRVTALTETWAELDAGGGTPIVLKHADGEAHVTAGFTPFIALDVERLDEVVPRALQVRCVGARARPHAGCGRCCPSHVLRPTKNIPSTQQLGARLDGPVRHETTGKAAALRAPDGHMVGLYERDSTGVT